MFTFIAIVIGVVLVFLGYILHGGHLEIFMHAWTESITIGGAAAGILFASGGMDGAKQAIAAVQHLLKPNPYNKKEFNNLLATLYQIFNLARREGLLGLESHLSDPHKSSIISQNHAFVHNHHATVFFCDTMKLIVDGGVKPLDLSDMMEMDLETMHKEEHRAPHAVHNVGDAMPAIGICACVLGVVYALGKIGGDPAEIGQGIAVALCGTFAGVLLAYMVFFPITTAIETRITIEGMYLQSIRHAVFSFARGEAPLTCIEFARRNIEPAYRPTFAEMETAAKGKK